MQVIVICNKDVALLTSYSTVREIKVATVIRVAVRRSVIRVKVREAVVGAIVPIATNTAGPHNVRIDEVSIAPAVPSEPVSDSSFF